jgi:hypothetical protein
MALPASGEISINDINVEFGRSGTTANSSLEDLSDGTVATINTANASADRPDGSAPHNISEFYSYDHSAVAMSWGSWSTSSWNIGNDVGTTSYANRSITFSGASGSNVDIYYNLTSGTVRGGLSVALSTSAFPTNSDTFYTVNSSSGSFGASFALSGSGTLYCRFKYITHASLLEESIRNIVAELDGVTSGNMSLSVGF